MFLLARKIMSGVENLHEEFLFSGRIYYNESLFQPGVVATLIEDRNGGVTYGVAFQLINEAALDYLNNREVALGGYISHITMFQPRDKSRLPMPVLLYVATPSNQHWIGDATADHIANQVRYLFTFDLILNKHFKLSLLSPGGLAKINLEIPIL